MLDALAPAERPSLLRRLLAVAWPGPSQGWSPHIAWRDVPFVDGETARGTMMRRYFGGRWQYRRMTNDEQIDAVIDRTW